MVFSQILAKMTRREFSIFITFSDTYTCSYAILFSSSRASSPEQAQNVSLIDDSVLDNNVLGAATSDCKII